MAASRVIERYKEYKSRKHRRVTYTYRREISVKLIMKNTEVGEKFYYYMENYVFKIIIEKSFLSSISISFVMLDIIAK